MEKFEYIVDMYGEGNLLEDVYVGNMEGMDYGDVLYTLEEDSYFIKELVRRLDKYREDGYSKEILEEDAECYHRGLVKMFKETNIEDNWEEVIQNLITKIHKKYGEGLLYNRDIVRVLVGVIPYIGYESREQVVVMYQIKDLLNPNNKHLKDRLTENAPKYIRDNESFRKSVNLDNVETYDDFIEDLEYPYILKGKEYEDVVEYLLPMGSYDDTYLYYLEILEDREVEQGKEEAIKELSKRCPECFEDDKVWKHGVADLGKYTLTWRGEVRLTTRGYTMEDLPKQEWAVKSTDKEIILGWVDYNNLYEAFHGETVGGERLLGEY